VPPKSKPKFTRRDFLRWSGAGALGSVVPFIYADRSADWLSVEEIELRIPNWEADGFRAVVISDVHMTSDRHYRAALEAVWAAKQQKADVILAPGDFIDTSGPKALSYLREFCRRLGNAKCPVFATMGNHDYATTNPRAVIHEIEKSNIKLLRNEVAELDGVSIGGIDDALFDKHRPDVLATDKLSKSLLTMLHEPDYVDDMPKNVSLQISGHSHGGQICLPFGIPVHTPFGARKYIDGFYPDANVPLFVTRGVGTTGLPYRMFCRPQIAVLTIRQA
jgi:predicted MPP superfamily phosphohydrolase